MSFQDYKSSIEFEASHGTPAGPADATFQWPSARVRARVLCLLLDLVLPGGLSASYHRPVPERPQGHMGLLALLCLAVPQEVLGTPSSLWGKTWAGTCNPQPWHGAACLCPKPLIAVAREPGACSLLQWVGKALLCQLPPPLSLASALRRKRPLLARGKQSRLLGTKSRTSFGGETCKEARIKLFKADAFLFIQ